MTNDGMIRDQVIHDWIIDAGKFALAAFRPLLDLTPFWVIKMGGLACLELTQEPAQITPGP